LVGSTGVGKEATARSSRPDCLMLENMNSMQRPVGFESTSDMITREFCGAAWSSKELKRKGGNRLCPFIAPTKTVTSGTLDLLRQLGGYPLSTNIALQKRFLVRVLADELAMIRSFEFANLPV
jgi:hypothetical protein